jgi:hypothetical protein
VVLSRSVLVGGRRLLWYSIGKTIKVDRPKVFSALLQKSCNKKQKISVDFEKLKPQRIQRAQRRQKEILFSVLSVSSVVRKCDFWVAGGIARVRLIGTKH